MTSNWNPETLTRSLSSSKSGAVAVVVYSNSYAPSLQTLSHVKKLLVDFPSIQLMPLNADEQRHLLGIPILNIAEVPSVSLFFRGRPFCQSLSDIYQITNRIHRLAIQSMEIDDFESVGTTFKIPDGADVEKWRLACGPSFHQTTASAASLLAPMWTVMDSVYDI